MNTFKMKFLVVGHEVTVDGGSIERVAEFSYLGSLIAANGRIDVEVDSK